MINLNNGSVIEIDIEAGRLATTRRAQPPCPHRAAARALNGRQRVRRADSRSGPPQRQGSTTVDPQRSRRTSKARLPSIPLILSFFYVSRGGWRGRLIKHRLRPLIKMKMQCIVVSDKIIERAARGDFAASRSRQLVVMDRDSTPLTAMLTVTIDEKDPVSPADRGGDTSGLVVTLAITDLAQYEGNKKLAAKGHLISLDGRLELQPLAELQSPAKKAA